MIFVESGKTQYNKTRKKLTNHDVKKETLITFELESINHFSGRSFGKKTA